MAPPLVVDVWSDIACPWCYVGKRRLEAALERFPHAEEVEVRWHAFELDPSAPPVREPEPYADRLARKYGTSPEKAQEMIDTMTGAGAGEGLELRFDRIRPGNTFDAHRLVHLAQGRGLAGAMKERLLRAYLTEGEAIGDREVLVRLAGEVGLDPDAARALLEGDELTEEVRADEARARALDIGGVPFFVVAGRYGISGAQPPPVLLEALTVARREQTGTSGEPPPAGACGPEGCD